MDLFDLHGKKYVIVIDYLSREAKIHLVQEEAASATIQAAKTILTIKEQKNCSVCACVCACVRVGFCLFLVIQSFYFRNLIPIIRAKDGSLPRVPFKKQVLRQCKNTVKTQPWESSGTSASSTGN